MSTKLCICDIDGVVADATARFAVAEEVKQAYMRQMLDTLIAGVNDALNTLLQAGYHIVFLTSRPQRMAVATLEWFSLHVFVERECGFVFKAPAFQYVKTVVWKAGMVQTLAAFYDASEVVFIDDEESNWTPLKNAGPYLYALERYASLAEAIDALKEERHGNP